MSVESLNFEMASCLDDTEDSDGFDDLCREATRFTHFYSTSPLSQSTMASLLTGLPATEHKVFTNGSQGIPFTIDTSAELARRKGFRTFFLSGGPPLLAKSGFAQGFEDFDDDFLRESKPYKPSREVLEKALQLLTQEPKDTHYMHLYLPDLQFSFIGTFSDDGREREKSIQGQKKEVGESLRWFFNQMKEQNIWDRSYVIVLGLNGDASSSRKTLLQHENLFRENIHVPLFIKPPAHIPSPTAAVNTLVSPVRLGQWLRELISATTPKQMEKLMQKLETNAEVFLSTRSDWRTSWFDLPANVALRSYDYLILPETPPRLYHTLIDKGENFPMTLSQAGRSNVSWFDPKLFPPSSPATPGSHLDLYEFLKFLHAQRLALYSQWPLRMSPNSQNSFGERVMADRALKDKDTKRVQAYTESLQNNPACLRMLKSQPRKRDLQRCKDPLFLNLLEWEKNFPKEESLAAEKTFIRKFRAYMQAKRLAYINLYLELYWDTPVFEYIGPSLTELYLHLPQKAALRRKVEEYKIPLYTGLPQP